MTADTKPARPPSIGAPASVWPAIIGAFREHALLLAIVVLHGAVVAALPLLLGRPLRFSVGLGDIEERILVISFWCVLLAAIIGFVVAALRGRDGGPLRSAWLWLRRDFLRADRLIGGVIVMALLPVFAWNFGFIQALLPFLHPINWDPVFAAWDRGLHFGTDPWRLLQPMLGFPIVTAAISLAYALWFFVLYIVNAWQAFSVADRLLRMQYLLTTVLIWAVLGNVFCTLLASGGPVYYGRLTGLPDPFAEQLQYLDAANAVWRNLSRGIQETMWSAYQVNGRDGVITGAIAAMPSLHVATAFSFWLVVRRGLPRLQWVLFGFLVVMMLGSVHLAWHYAIDGYAGMFGTWVIWRACGWLLRRPAVARLLWGHLDITA
jgi:hypothetical protein